MTLVGSALPGIPWEDRPPDCRDPVWRYSRNPIITRDATPTSNSVFNSGIVSFRDGYAGVFRCDNRAREMRLHPGFSANGVAWRIEPEPIAWQVPPGVDAPEYGYDPRVCWIPETPSPFSGWFVPANGEGAGGGVSPAGRYWVTWCSGFHGPCIGIGWTDDFRTFTMLENALLPYNRNGVLFPRKIGGRYMMLSRPSDNGHTPFGEMFLSQSEDMVHWGRHRWVMRGEQPWESTKIGAGPVPIETDEGWLLFYHGVLTSCNGFVYHCGACLLDLDEPWKVVRRGKPYLLSPQMPYEQVGDVPNVVFPCAALADATSGRIAIYYGGADTVTCLAFATVDSIDEVLSA